jgi:hypothetical protein
MIHLPAEPHNDLNWLQQIEEASSLEKITWKLDLGLEKPYFPLEDELYFQAITAGLAHFSTAIWPKFQEKTECAVLYQGAADFSEYFVWTERQEANWLSWKEDRPDGDEAHLRRLFCAEAFVAYFQMLAHRLPDELPLKLILDVSHCGTKAQTLHLLSPERFEHFLIEALPEQEASFGICFPSDEHCSLEILERIDQLISRFNIPFKAVYEPLMTEQWDGLDNLYVFSRAVTSQGKRKLMGFCAAGGRVVTEGILLGMSNEIGAEGFEPPTYWSQTSRASQTALCPEKQEHPS